MEEKKEQKSLVEIETLASIGMQFAKRIDGSKTKFNKDFIENFKHSMEKSGYDEESSLIILSYIVISSDEEFLRVYNDYQKDLMRTAAHYKCDKSLVIAKILTIAKINYFKKSEKKVELPLAYTTSRAQELFREYCELQAFIAVAQGRELIPQEVPPLIEPSMSIDEAQNIILGLEAKVKESGDYLDKLYSENMDFRNDGDNPRQ